MDSQLENKQQMEKDILLNDLNNISQFIHSTNEASQYFSLYNEKIYQNHNKWLDDFKTKIIKGIDNSDQNITISDINYDNQIIDLIKKVAEPHNYRNNNENKEKINNNEIFEKIDELTNFNDIIGAVNTCSKRKRNSLLATINKKNNNNNENIDNNNINSDNINDYLDDIKIDDPNSNDNKESIINNNNLYPIETNEEDDEIENSLCTIVEQPSVEDMEKNTFSQKSINFLNSKQYTFSNRMNNKMNNKIGGQNIENNNNNYILDLNNNANNTNNDINIEKVSPNTDNKKYKPLKILESIANTPDKLNNYFLSQNFNNNNHLLTNSNNKAIHENPYNSQQKSPYFGQINNNIKSSNKDMSPVKADNFVNTSQFSFNNTNQKSVKNNNNEFTFSTIKKADNNNFSNNKINNNINLSSNKNNVIKIHTSKKNILSNNKNDNNSNNSNNKFINALANGINNTINKNKSNDQNIQINQISNNNFQNNNFININNNNNSTNKIDFNNNNGLYQNKYVQDIVLTSTKKNDNNLNDNKNIKIKDKYEDDFEEYEMSDSSNIKDDDAEDSDKFIPKWAMDEEYINNKIMQQNNDKDLIIESFGNFVVENLNLNMIFETHNEEFDVRHSTADWRGDDSFARNKVTNINDKEIDVMFPNRKLQF